NGDNRARFAMASPASKNEPTRAGRKALSVHASGTADLWIAAAGIDTDAATRAAVLHVVVEATAATTQIRARTRVIAGRHENDRYYVHRLSTLAQVCVDAVERS